MSGSMAIIRPCGWCGEVDCGARCRQCVECGELTHDVESAYCSDDCEAADTARAKRDSDEYAAERETDKLRDDRMQGLGLWREP